MDKDNPPDGCVVQRFWTARFCPGRFAAIMSDMPNKVRWGVLGTAKIAVKKVIPGMQKSEWSEVTAIASRDRSKAEDAARALGIAKAYGSYEELLADPQIDAIYNPLPNQLHVPWSIKAAEAGKHVLCEKPLSLTVAEARQLLAARDRAKVKIGEAFMVRTHPQWLRVRELVASGRIGQLRAATGFFSYFNNDPANIRNIPEYGGGAVMDIGCYPINTSRFIFGEEPSRVMGLVERDPQMKVDRLTSAMLDFPSGNRRLPAACSWCLINAANFSGPRGGLKLKSRSMLRPTALAGFLSTTAATYSGAGSRSKNSWSATSTHFKATRSRGPSAKAVKCRVSLEDAIRNMAVIEAIFRSAESGGGRSRRSESMVHPRSLYLSRNYLGRPAEPRSAACLVIFLVEKLRPRLWAISRSSRKYHDFSQ